MNDKIVYRSTDAGVLEAWESASAALHEYIAATKAVLTERGLGERDVYRSTGVWNFGQFSGIGLLPDEDSPPPGWRLTVNCLVPDKRVKAGREVRAAMDAIKCPGHPGGSLPGMPGDVLHGNRILVPRVRTMDGALYAEWDAEPGPHEASFSSRTTHVDATLWERVKLSEYYAAREAEDAKRETAAVA